MYIYPQHNVTMVLYVRVSFDLRLLQLIIGRLNKRPAMEKTDMHLIEEMDKN